MEKWKKISHTYINFKKRKKSSSSNINTRCKLQSRVNYQGQRLILYNDKRANPPRRHSIPECVCINQQACKIYEAKSDRTERRDQQGYRRTQDHDQQNLIDVYRAPHTITGEYPFFPSSRGTLTK